MKLLSLVTPILLMASAAAADHETAVQEFIKAFKNGDAPSMAKFFGEDVIFAGEYRFVGLEKPMKEPKSFKGQFLKESYEKLIADRGAKQWTEMMAKTKPTIVVSEKDGELLGFAKKGDVICDMHMREAKKGERNGFDEAVIFVFRKVDDSYKVVFHIADW